MWFGRGGLSHRPFPSSGTCFSIVVEVSLVLFVVELLPGMREGARGTDTCCEREKERERGVNLFMEKTITAS